MRVLILCKAHYMNKDALADRYGRLCHLYTKLPNSETTVFYTSYKFDDMLATTEFGSVFMRSSILRSFIILWFYRLFRLVRQREPDVIVASSDVLQVILGAMLSSILKKPFIVDLYDDYSQFGMAKLPFVQTFYRKALGRANGIVTVSSTLADRVRAKVSRVPIYTIESTINDGEFYPVDVEQSRRKLGLPSEKKLVGLCGGLNKKHGVQVIFDLIAELAEEGSDIGFVVAGNLGPGISLPESRNVLYLHSLDHSQMNDFYNALDVCIIQLSDSEFGHCAFPQKAYEIIATNTPAVFANVGALGQLFRDIPVAGYQPDNTVSLRSAITYQLDEKVCLSGPVPTWEEQSVKMGSFVAEVMASVR